MATSSNVAIILEIQDNRGFKSKVKINLWIPAAAVAGSTLASMQGLTGNVATAFANMTNAKVVRQGYQVDWSYAQEPTSESGEYELVIQKAKLSFGDGNGGFNYLEVPAPVDALFLTTSQDNLIVVDPASSALTAFQTAFTTNVAQGALSAGDFNAATYTPRGGTWGAQFFGGQLVEGKAPRRRVKQGQ